jgi:hypothetical protein
MRPFLFKATEVSHPSRNLDRQRSSLQHQPGPHGSREPPESASSYPTYSTTRRYLHANRIRLDPSVSLVAMPKITECTLLPPQSFPQSFPFCGSPASAAMEKQPRRRREKPQSRCPRNVSERSHTNVRVRLEQPSIVEHTLTRSVVTEDVLCLQSANVIGIKVYS